MQAMFGRFTVRGAGKAFDSFIANKWTQRVAFGTACDAIIADLRDGQTAVRTGAKWIKENGPTIDGMEREMRAASPGERIMIHEF